MAEREGQQLGNYRLLKLLGQGSFAEVYLGEHIHLGTKAAIKLLHARIARNEVAPFKREARTLANLVHPNIVRVLEFGIDAESETPYLVMDYAPGGTLRQRHSKGLRLPLPKVVEYARQAAAGLQYAHDKKLIHRDVKPENMLLGCNGAVLLSDFGLALLAQSSHSQSTQDMAGTIAYMAPEQIKAHPRPASDQYSLAVVVYEWLCGMRPFNGSFTEVAVKHSITPPPSLRDHLPTLPLAVEQVVMTALAKKPEERFGSVQAFAAALEQASRDIPAQPMQSTSTSPNQLMSSTSTMTTQPARSTLPEQSEVAASRGISRRAVLLGAGGVVGVVLAGTSIELLTHKPQAITALLQPHPLPTSTPTSIAQPGKPQGTLYVMYRGHHDVVQALAWSPDGKRIASASHDNTVQVWNAADGGNAFIYRVHSDVVWAVAWSPDSTRIASASADRTVQVWNATDGGNAFTYPGHSDVVDTVAWSPDGKRIASASYDKTVRVWNAADGSNTFIYPGHTKEVWTVAWSPNGKRIASGGLDTTVQVWDAADGGNIFTYQRHSGGVEALAWSPDGKRIASASQDTTVQVWDAATGGNVFTYRGHSNYVDAVAWSPDGKRIASGSADKTVQVWDAATGGNVFTYRRHSNYVEAVAWSPDGKRIASGSDDKTVRVWQA